MSPRLGRRGLLQLHESLSDRDREVIHSVASHRFLTGKQLQLLHFSDHATSDTGARVCRHVLSRLTKERVFRRLRRRVGGIRAGSASFVYTLGPVGRRLVGGTAARTVGEPSAMFLEHTLAVADVHLALRTAAARGQFELVRVEIEPTCWRSFMSGAGMRDRVRPDLYVVSARGQLEYCWFVEVDLGTEHKPTLIRKCRTYESYWRTGLEQRRTGTFPLVLWVTSDDRRSLEIEKAIGAARALKRELFRVTSQPKLTDLFSGSAP